MSSENKRPFIRKYVISVNMVAAFPTLKVEDIQRLIERLYLQEMGTAFSKTSPFPYFKTLISSLTLFVYVL